jgi:hypothetical protein
MFLLLLGIIVVAAATVWWLLLKWEVWGLAVAAPDGADTHTGPASSWASAAGAQRQPSVVATASWELQQLLGEPVELTSGVSWVQPILMRMHVMQLIDGCRYFIGVFRLVDCMGTTHR